MSMISKNLLEWDVVDDLQLILDIHTHARMWSGESLKQR